MDQKEKIVSLLLRIALAFSFIYAGISIFMTPDNWIGFLPDFVKNLGGYSALYGHATFDLILGLWLLSNKWTFWASIISALNLAAISIFNLAQLDIIFRDVSLLIVAVALAFLTKKN
jgi:uncharacterized membrane protein YphA (DoxX/SURF4 family)